MTRLRTSVSMEILPGMGWVVHRSKFRESGKRYKVDVVERWGYRRGWGAARFRERYEDKQHERE